LSTPIYYTSPTFVMQSVLNPSGENRAFNV